MRVSVYIVAKAKPFVFAICVFIYITNTKLRTCRIMCIVRMQIQMIYASDASFCVRFYFDFFCGLTKISKMHLGHSSPIQPISIFCRI